MKRFFLTLLLFFIWVPQITAQECPDCELVYAAANGHVDRIEELIAQGADVHANTIVTLVGSPERSYASRTFGIG